MTKPIVLVDMDGPLADFEGHFYMLCAEQGFVMHGGDVHVDRRCTEHRFLADCLEGEDRSQSRHVVEAGHWFDELPVTDGAVAGITELAHHADVWICTKPLEANPYCRDDKAAWVRRHLGASWERRLILTPDKSMIRGDILLDDAPKHDWLDDATWNPVMFTMPWNGPGSAWDGIPHWTWGDPIEDLLVNARSVAVTR